MTFIKKYWEGNVSLPISFWIVSWCTNLFAIFITHIMKGFIEGSTIFDPLNIFLAFSLTQLCLTIMLFWRTVGVLRSAVNYIKNPTKTKIWGYLAIFIILVGLFGNIFPSYIKTIVPQFVSLYKIAFLSDPDIAPYKITVVENGRELLIEGGIKHGLLKDLKKAIKFTPSITTINLESVGGRHGEAKDLYNYISKKGLDTVTNKRCVSACTIIFAAGRNRWLGIKGRLGFHSASFVGMSNNEVNKGLQEIYSTINKDKGILLNIFYKGNKVDPKKMWYPTRDELLTSKFITSKISPVMSSLKSTERALNKSIQKLKISLPKKLDEVTTLIDVRVKLNKIVATHTVSESMSKFMATKIGQQSMRKLLLENQCKNKATKNLKSLGVLYEYIYLSPSSKSKILSVTPSKCP